MARHSSRRTTDDPAPVRRLKAARRVSMIIGLTLAAAVAAAMYVMLFRVPASTGPQVASHKASTFRRLVEFTLASAPDSVQLDPDGKIVMIVTANDKVTAWSTTNRPRRHSFTNIPGGTQVGSQYLNPLVFSPNGREFSVLGTDSSGDAAVDIWNVTTGQATSVPLSVDYAAPGPNGLVAASYQEGTLSLVSVTTGLPDATLLVNRAPGVSHQIGQPAFSPDGRTIAVSDDRGEIHLVNVLSKHIAATLVAEKIYNVEWNLTGLSNLDIDTLTFSPDSKRVACGSDTGIVRVWDVPTGRNVSAFNVNGNASGSTAARPVKTLVFSPDGRMLVTADNADNTIAVWDTTSGRRVATLEAGGGIVTSAAFTANGALLVTTISNVAKHHRIEIWTTGQSLTVSP
jgi:WD40 repeat protein